MAWWKLRGRSTRRSAAARAADELHDLYTHACDLADDGDHAGAVAAYRRAVADSARIHGTGDMFTLDLMSSLASALVALGDLAGARDVRQRAFDISRHEPGYFLVTAVYAVNGLASVQLAQGDLDGARDGYRQALAWCREDGFDERHPEVGAARNGLARTLAARREHAAAEDLYIEAVGKNGQALGSAHPDTVAAARNRDLVRSLPGAGGGWAALMVAGDLAGARRLLTPARPAAGGDQPPAASGDQPPAASGDQPPAALSALGEVLREQRDMMAAYRAYERVTETGAGPDAVAARYALAQVMLLTGDSTNASTMLTEGLTMLRALLGDHHPDVATARAHLDWVRAL